MEEEMGSDPGLHRYLVTQGNGEIRVGCLQGRVTTKGGESPGGTKPLGACGAKSSLPPLW